MRKLMLLIILFILAINISFGQVKKGFIIDPDGYTNIRELASGDSKIITKVIVGELFNYSESNENWYSVETYNGIKGFMHKSRIKEYKINLDCWGEYFTEIVSYRKSGQVITASGIPHKLDKLDDIYVGISISDCLNKNDYLKFGENGYYKFEFVNGQFIVYEYLNLPVNNNFESEFVPFSLNRLFFIGDKVEVVKNSPYYQFPKLEKQQINIEKDKLSNQQFDKSEYYKLINIVLVLALNDKELETFFYNLEKELNITFDGEYQERYYSVLKVYEICKYNR